MTSRCEATTRTMPGAAVIELSGEVDGSAADVLTKAYQDAVTGTELGIVVLDFASVVYINSTGIALIVSILARARAERRKVVASGLSA
ncbi:MAG TPA: STAS domain-containing protein, partial [Trebonia sp.]|nr:STAS domain-containing protein [Trebonia sp.]